jgi:hypothetical protein
VGGGGGRRLEDLEEDYEAENQRSITMLLGAVLSKQLHEERADDKLAGLEGSWERGEREEGQESAALAPPRQQAGAPSPAPTPRPASLPPPSSPLTAPLPPLLFRLFRPMSPLLATSISQTTNMDRLPRKTPSLASVFFHDAAGDGQSELERMTMGGLGAALAAGLKPDVQDEVEAGPRASGGGSGGGGGGGGGAGAGAGGGLGSLSGTSAVGLRRAPSLSRSSSRSLVVGTSSVGGDSSSSDSEEEEEEERGRWSEGAGRWRRNSGGVGSLSNRGRSASPAPSLSRGASVDLGVRLESIAVDVSHPPASQPAAPRVPPPSAQ